MQKTNVQALGSSCRSIIIIIIIIILLLLLHRAADNEVISDCCKIASLAVFEILHSKRIGFTSFTFRWEKRRHRPGDHLIPHRLFPVGGPLEPSLYL